MNPLLAALAGGYLLFNSAALPRKAEQKFESALQQAFPTAKIDVHIKGKRGFDVINGKFRSVRVEMRDFQLKPAPAPPASPANERPPGELPANELLLAPGSPPAARPPTPPAPKPLLTIMTTAAAKDRGHVGHTEISLKNFALGTLPVSSLDASFEDVTYDWKELKSGRALALESAGPAKLSLVLPASSLESVLKGRLNSIQNAHVALQDGLLRITGTRAAPMVGTQLPVLFTGRLTAYGNEIRIEDTSLAIGGAPMPGMVTRSLLGEINPVFHFEHSGTAPYRIELTGASAENDALSLYAMLVFVPAVKPVITVEPVRK